MNLKKLTAVLLAFVMVLALCACGYAKPAPSAPEDAAAPASPAAAAAAPEAAK